MSVTEHHMGCGCPSCKNNMQNIDGYASGFELAPDPNQDITPDQLNDPNFIASIVAQVLQQLGDDGSLEEWAPAFGGQFAQVMADLSPALDTDYEYNYNQNFLYPPLGSNTGINVPGVIAGIPCGQVGPNYQSMVSQTGMDKDIDFQKFNDKNQGVFTKGNKQFWDNIKTALGKRGISEGSCGYNETTNGQTLKTPGGTKGVKAHNRTQEMLKQYVRQEIKKLKEQEDPRRPKDIEFDNAQAMSRLTPDDRDKVGKIQQMMQGERNQYEKVAFVYTEQGGHFYGLDVYESKDQDQRSDKLKYDDANEWLKGVLEYIHEEDLIPRRYNSGIEDLDLIVERLEELGIEASHGDYMDVS